MPMPDAITARRRPLVYLLWLLLPLVVIVQATWLTAARGPYDLGANLDPEYLYLGNGLMVAEGMVPWNTDNPGTPLQMLGGLTMAVLHTVVPVQRDTTLAQDVLGHPEHYLGALHWVVLLWGAAVLAAVGVVLYHRTGRWSLALAVQAVLVLAPVLLTEAARVRPEPLLASYVLLLVLVLPPLLPEAPLAFGWRRSVALGVLLALGVATKFTFVPLLALLILPWQRRLVLGAVLAFVVALPLCLWPALPQAGPTLAWIVNLLTHSGHYGAGQVGLPGLGELAAHARDLALAVPAFVVALAAAVVAVALLTRRWLATGRPAGVAHQLLLAVLLLLAMLALTAAVVKHPSDHYLVPVMVALAPLLLVLDALSQATMVPPAWRARGVAVTLLILAGGALHSVVGVVQEGQAARRYAQDTLALRDRIARNYSDSPVFCYYRCSAPGFALTFANDSTGWAFTETLLPLYPRALGYNNYAPVAFHRFGVLADMPGLRRLITAGRTVLLWGSPIKPDQTELFPFRLTQVDGTPNEGVYRIDAILHPLPAEERATAPASAAPLPPPAPTP